MEVSFIIPTYNREKLIAKTIDSIKNSSKLKDHEIIVVDDNSSDNTVSMLKKYGDVRVVQNEANKGPAVCRNQGMHVSKGNYLFFIDSDVFLTTGCFEKLYEAIQGCDLIFPTIIFEDGTRMYPSNENEEKFLKASTVFMIRKESLKRLDELFDPAYYMVEEDTDFFMRCKLFGLKCKYERNATAYHVLEPSFSLNLERKYSLTTKNQMYGWLKLCNISPEVTELFNFPSTKLIFKDLIMALFNINLLSITSVDGRMKVRQGYLGKIKMLLRNHQRITSRNRLFLIYLLLKAVTWNIGNIGNTLKKRKSIKKRISKKLSF